MDDESSRESDKSGKGTHWEYSRSATPRSESSEKSEKRGGDIPVGPRDFESTSDKDIGNMVTVDNDAASSEVKDGSTSAAPEESEEEEMKEMRRMEEEGEEEKKERKEDEEKEEESIGGKDNDQNTEVLESKGVVFATDAEVGEGGDDEGDKDYGSSSFPIHSAVEDEKSKSYEEEERMETIDEKGGRDEEEEEQDVKDGEDGMKERKSEEDKPPPSQQQSDSNRRRSPSSLIYRERIEPSPPLPLPQEQEQEEKKEGQETQKYGRDTDTKETFDLQRLPLPTTTTTTTLSCSTPDVVETVCTPSRSAHAERSPSALPPPQSSSDPLYSLMEEKAVDHLHHHHHHHHHSPSPPQSYDSLTHSALRPSCGRHASPQAQAQHHDHRHHYVYRSGGGSGRTSPSMAKSSSSFGFRQNLEQSYAERIALLEAELEEVKGRREKLQYLLQQSHKERKEEEMTSSLAQHQLPEEEKGKNQRPHRMLVSHHGLDQSPAEEKRTATITTTTSATVTTNGRGNARHTSRSSPRVSSNDKASREGEGGGGGERQEGEGSAAGGGVIRVPRLYYGTPFAAASACHRSSRTASTSHSPSCCAFSAAATHRLPLSTRAAPRPQGSPGGVGVGGDPSSCGESATLQTSTSPHPAMFSLALPGGSSSSSHNNNTKNMNGEREITKWKKKSKTFHERQEVLANAVNASCIMGSFLSCDAYRSYTFAKADRFLSLVQNGTDLFYDSSVLSVRSTPGSVTGGGASRRNESNDDDRRGKGQKMIKKEKFTTPGPGAYTPRFGLLPHTKAFMKR